MNIKAQISADVTSGCAPLTDVQFTSPVPGDWDFGDGGTATGETNPEASFSDPGVYNVTFDNGAGVTDEITITVFGKPNAAFTVNDSTECAPFNVVFTDLSTPYDGTTITAWQWDFGDGTGSNLQNPTHTYSSVNDYSIALTVTDNNGCDTAFVLTDFIRLKNPPTASFTASPTSSCTSPLNVTLTNNSVNGEGGTTDLTYAWDFGDGETSTDRDPGPRTYTDVGSYTITLDVTEADGCTRTTSRTVSIGAPEAIISSRDTICINAPETFTNASVGGSSVTWTFDGADPTSTTNPDYTFTTPGEHTVELIVRSGACADTTSKTVFVQEVTVDIAADPTYLCEEPYCIQFNATGTDIVDWSYSFGDGATSTEQDPEHCYTFGGDEYTVHYFGGYYYNVRLTGTSEYGCIGRASIEDTLFPLSANFAPNITQGCAPLEVNFADSSASGSTIVSYEYDFDDGSTATSEDATHTFTTAGEYDVTLIIENERGCRDTSFPITVNVGEPIDLDLNVTPSTVCIGEPVIVTDATGDARIDGYHFSTDENRGSEACPDDSIQQWSYFHETGTHDITFYADYNGCITEEVFADAVTVNGPSTKFNWTGLCADPTNITFTATPSEVDSLYWIFDDGTVIASDDIADTLYTHNFPGTGDYNVQLISTNTTSGCPNDTDSMVVTVRELLAVIDADTVICSGSFTPSGASSNDVSGNCENAYRWDFGDGTDMYLSNDPTFPTALTDTGSYDLRLMVYDVNGCRDTAEQTIVVTDVYAGFEADTTTGCIPLTINFTDTSVTASRIVDWDWRFGDGNTSSLENPSNTYNYISTSFEVELVVTDSLGCMDSTTMNINPIIPDSVFTVSDATVCVDDSMTFNLRSAGTIASATWDFDGIGSSTDISPRFAFPEAGDYTITVQITDTNGCNSQMTRTEYVEVDAYPDAGFTISVDLGDVLCAPQTVIFTDTTSFDGVTTYGSNRWNLDNGNPDIINSSSPIGTYALPGTYTPSLIVSTSNGCTDTFELDIPIVGPQGNFDISRTVICVGDEVTFTLRDTVDVATFSWDFNDGTTAVEEDPITHTFTTVPDGGVQTIELFLEGLGNGCPFPVTKTINIHEIEARFEIDTTVCLDSAVVFNDNSLVSSSTTYFWDIGNGTTYSTTEPFPQTYESVGPGNYDVMLVVTDPVTGCIDTMIQELTIYPFPTITATDGEMCEGESAFISASGGEFYSWEDPDGYLNTPDLDTTTASPLVTTDFTVTGNTEFYLEEDTTTCKNTAVSTVTVFTPTEKEDVDTCVIIGQTVTIGKDYGPGYTYDWNEGPTDFLVCTDCATQTIQITEEIDSITYEVRFEDPLGCFPDVSTYKVCIIDNYTVDVPTAFTPDGTGENNIVYVNGHGIEELIYFRIYNRWGELVFETNNLSVGWDGNYKGNAQDMETFVWQARVKFYNGEFEEKGGELTLIR